MRYLLSILCFTYLFSIEITVGDARSVPEFGFNGNTVRGPSWLSSEFTDSVGTMKPHLLRYPEVWQLIGIGVLVGFLIFQQLIH